MTRCVLLPKPTHPPQPCLVCYTATLYSDGWKEHDAVELTDDLEVVLLLQGKSVTRSTPESRLVTEALGL